MLSRVLTALNVEDIRRSRYPKGFTQLNKELQICPSIEFSFKSPHFQTVLGPPKECGQSRLHSQPSNTSSKMLAGARRLSHLSTGSTPANANRLRSLIKPRRIQSSRPYSSLSSKKCTVIHLLHYD